MITRRQFLRAVALGGGIVAGKLWTPGATKIFLPASGGVVGNSYIDRDGDTLYVRGNLQTDFYLNEYTTRVSNSIEDELFRMMI